MPDVDLDPSAALPRLNPLRAALAAHDWHACRRLLEEAAPVERTMLVWYGHEGRPGLEGFLRWVLGGDPDDTGAAALLAADLVARAWSVRTSARAGDVGREQVDRFHAGLRAAELVLIEAAARNPSDAAVWVLRLRTARGLELGLSEVRRRYDRLALVDPHHLPGQRQLLQSLCPKWGGTWALADRFAHEAMLAAAPGGLDPVLVADAHIERWLEGEPRIDDRRYFADDLVRAEIDEAAQRSVLHPAFVPTPGWVDVVSTFAFVFTQRDDQARAAQMFERLGALSSRAPWEYVSDDPAAVVRVRRSRALASVGRAR